MTHESMSSSESSARAPLPLLWCPGVLRTWTHRRSTGPAIVQVGRCVGWLPDTHNEPARWSIDVVQRSALSDALRAEFGLVLPEDRLDSGVLPQVHRAAQACPLVRVTAAQRAHLVARGVPVFHVVYGRAQHEWYVSIQGGEKKTDVTGGSLESLLEKSLPVVGEASTEALVRTAYLDSIADRLLSALSDGVLSLDAVRLARMIPSLGSDGSEPEPVPDLSAWDTWLAEVFDHANAFTATTDALADAVRALPSEARQGTTHEVPFYDTARAVSLPSLRVPLVPPLHVVARNESSHAEATVDLPPRTVWVVDAVEPWVPATNATPDAPEVETPAQGVNRAVLLALMGIAFMLVVLVVLARRIPREPPPARNLPAHTQR